MYNSFIIFEKGEMIMTEQEMKNKDIKQRIIKFADEIEAKYLAEYNEKIKAGEKDVEKESISEIHYYEEIKFSSRLKNYIDL